METKDLYQVLGVARGASEDEIRKAYRKLARETHPDVNPNDKAAEERFKEVSFANEVLIDKEKRKLYDEFGADGLSSSFDPEQARTYQRWQRGARQSPHGTEPGFDLNDLFGDLFSRGGPIRGRDVEGDVDVDFLDAVRGGEVRVQFAGRGTLRVRIPAGAKDGTKIRLAGQGEPGPGGAAGDLFLRLHVRPHSFYRREGDALHVELPVTLPELVKGASIEVPTPDGPVKMTVPPRSANGRKLRLRGKGVSTRAGRGDLYVTLRVELPTPEDPEAEKQLEELVNEMEPLYADEDVRAALKGS